MTKELPTSPALPPPPPGVRLARVELPMGSGIAAGTAGRENNFTHENYDLYLGSIYAPSMAQGSGGAWVAVVTVKHKTKAMDPTLVPLLNVAGWSLYEEKHGRPKDTSQNTQAVVPGRGGGHSPAVSGKVDPKDVLPGPKA